MSASLLQYRSTVCFHCADNIITIIVLPLLAIFLHTWLFLRQRIYLSAAALCPMLLAVVPNCIFLNSVLFLARTAQGLGMRQTPQQNLAAEQQFHRQE